MSRSWHFVYDICGQPCLKKTASFYLLPRDRKVGTRFFSNFVFILYLKFDEAIKQKRMDI